MGQWCTVSWAAIWGSVWIPNSCKPCPAWAPEPVPELLEKGGLVEDGAPVVGVVAVASVARGRCVQRGASLGSSVRVGRGVASLGAAAPVGQAPSEAVRQATAALLVAQL